MRIALLGELEVLDDSERNVVVTGAKQRALLAVLALHAGRAVSADQLVDALWGEDPPPAVRNGLQGLVSKLRRSLGSAGLVAMRSGGYALELPPDAIDAHRYELLVAEGRAAAAGGSPARAIALLAEADSLWRGDALAEFTFEEFASVPITRLSELRLAAVEERLDAELRLGRHQGVIGDLDVLVTSHPLRERPRGLLMLALYRAGRQGDALRVYQEGRRVLGEELGVAPGPELRQLEAAILAQDPSLGAPAVAGPGTAAWTEQRSTIQESLTPLVGRDEELRDLTRLLEEHRLVTLVGPGGVGKTRLALEAARARGGALTYGGCLVELAPVGDPAGVPAAITSALDLPDPSRLAEMIGERDLLILLDNCEHVIATAAEVAEDLLRRCPGLQVLATSREGLRVGGETIWPVPPLAADDAVALFVARARAAGARLDVSDDVLPIISEICARLDGLPLAIELAAARTRAFPIRQILSRLTDRFRLLTGGSRTALPRQQTLRAVVDWSYELLFDDEQRVFERLSVFPGGCDLATAQAVCGDESLPGPDVEDIIHALVEKSLVIATPKADALRVTQLQTLAQYGREKLAERGEAARIRDAMAAHFARLCAGSAAAFIGDQQRAWLTAVDQEQDNLRGALEWAVANDDAETALTIAGGASWPHWLAGTMVEAKRWLDDAFSCGGEARETTRALALTGRGLIDFQLGAPERVDADLEAALATFRNHHDVASMALTYSFYAEVAAARGETDEARTRRLEVLAFYMALPDEPFAIAARAYSQAKLGLLDCDLARAERWYREAAAGFSRVDRPMMRAICLDVVANFDERAGDHRGAIKKLEEAVETNDELGLRGFQGAVLARLGWVLLHAGNTARAELMYRRALDLARRLNHAPVAFLALTGLAVLHRLNGRDGEAATAGTEALELFLVGSPRRLTNRVDPNADVLTAAAACCAVLGSVAGIKGNGEQAAQLLGHADRLRTDAGTPVPTFQRVDLDRARNTAVTLLGDEAFLAAFERGQRGRLGRDVAFTVA
ncbi:MAG: BTAD domain-containing putative transcriptional regulator [Ilumatobacteraceae bacterium]